MLTDLSALSPHVAVAAAYFAFGVAVGAFLRQSHASAPIAVALIAPGVIAGIGFLAWTVYTLA